MCFPAGGTLTPCRTASHRTPPHRRRPPRRRQSLASPEADDGTFLADVALGLVLGGLCGGHAVEDGQPHHGLGLQAHPVQEHGGVQLRLVVGLQGEERLSADKPPPASLTCSSRLSGRGMSGRHVQTGSSCAPTVQCWSRRRTPPPRAAGESGWSRGAGGQGAAGRRSPWRWRPAGTRLRRRGRVRGGRDAGAASGEEQRLTSVLVLQVGLAERHDSGLEGQGPDLSGAPAETEEARVRVAAARRSAGLSVRTYMS